MLQRRFQYESAYSNNVLQNENILISYQNEHEIDQGSCQKFAKIEVSSNHLQSVCHLEAYDPQCCSSPIVGETVFLFYNYARESFFIYHHIRDELVQETSKSIKPFHKITASCCSKLADQMTFFCYDEEPVIQAMYYTTNKANFTKTIRIPKHHIPNSKDRSIKNKITNIYCHPTRQILVLTFIAGNCLIYNYTNLHRMMVQDSKVANNGTSGDDPQPTAEEDPDYIENGIDTKLVSTKDQVKNRGKDSSFDSLFTSCGELSTPPMALFNMVYHNNKETAAGSENAWYATSFQFDCHGKSAVVVWSNLVSMVYDTSSLLKYTPSITRSISTITPAFSMTKNTAEPVNLLPTVGHFCYPYENTSSNIIVKLGSACFHNSEMLLFQTVFRYLTTYNYGIPTNRYGLKPTLNDSPCLLLAISTQDSRFILPVVNSVEIKATSSSHATSENHSNKMELHNYYPLFLHCTPSSGQLVIGFDKISPHLMISSTGTSRYDNLASLSAASNDFNLSTSVKMVTPSGYKSHAMWMKDQLQLNVSRSILINTFGISLQWLLQNGFSSLTVPMFSTLKVPPDSYMYGELVLCGNANYSFKSNSSTNQVVENSSFLGVISEETSGDMKQSTKMPRQYPMLLGIKTSIKLMRRGGSAESSYIPTVCYNIHTIDWWRQYDKVKPDGKASPNSANDNKKQMKFIVSLPSILTSSDVKRGNEDALYWLELPASDYLDITALSMENPSETLSNAITKKSLLSEEGENLLSMDSPLCRFAPTRIDLNESTYSTMDKNENFNPSNVNRWNALMKGTMWTILSGKTAAEVYPIAIFLQHSDETNDQFSTKNGNKLIYSNYRDVAYWQADQHTLLLPSTASNPLNVLAISKSGLEIKWIHSTQSSLPSFSAVKSSTQHSVSKVWKVQKELRSIYPAPKGAPSLVVLVTAANGVGNSDCESLHCLPTNIEFDLHSPSVAVFQLMRFERVMDIQWQILPSVLGSRSMSTVMGTLPRVDLPLSYSKLSSNLEKLRLQQRAWLRDSSLDRRDENMLSIGILTNCRVLMLSSKLQILNQVFHSQKSMIQIRSHRKANELILSHAGNDTVPENKNQQIEIISSIFWMGAALAYVNDSGCIKYITPSAHALTPLQRKPTVDKDGTNQLDSNDTIAQNETMRRALGLEDSRFTSGVLCSLPRNIVSNDGSLKVVAVLPDRLLLAFMKPESTHMSEWVHGQKNEKINLNCQCILPKIGFTARPMVPLEPLVMGLLELERSKRVNSTLNEGSMDGEVVSLNRFDVIQALICQYLPPLSNNSSGTNSGISSTTAFPTTQSTRQLFYSLSQMPGFEGLAMIVGGSTSSANELTVSADFPKTRWIPNGAKFLNALKTPFHQKGCMELLSSEKPLLQDLFLSHDTYGGNSLPHLRSLLGRRLSRSGLLLSNHGSREFGRKLCEIGSDYKLAGKLIADDAAEHAVQSNFGDLDNMLITLSKSKSNALRSQFVGLVKSLHSTSTSQSSTSMNIHYTVPHKILGEIASHSIDDTLSLSTIGRSDRFKMIQTVSQALSCQGPTSKSNNQRVGFDRKVLDSLQSNALVSRGGGGLKPSYGLITSDFLTLDLIEDFMGINLTLESQQSDPLLGNTGVGGTATSGVGGSHMEKIPTTWIEGVGEGREWDKVVGYWRFSDAVYPSSPMFSSLNIHPGSRLVFLDLSKFEGGLELISATSTSINILPTTSNIEPGDELHHDSAKCLCDVVYENDSVNSDVELQTVATSKTATGTDKIHNGLRALVRRGSQLDVGMYHSRSERSKLTIEISISYNNMGSDAGSGPSTYHLILQRCIAKLFNESDGFDIPAKSNLWTLFVDEVGAVCWTFSRDLTLASSGNTIKTAESIIPFKPTDRMTDVNSFESDDNVQMTWTHVAVVIDSTVSPTIKSGAEEVRSGPVKVTILINGLKKVEGTLTPPSILEDELTNTIMLVGPNLANGWRFTELRLWADVRSDNDIDNERDNMLVLGLKRKRVQLRIKGAKKLFSPWQPIAVGPSSETVMLPRVESSNLSEGLPASESVVRTIPAGTTMKSALNPKGTLLGPTNVAKKIARKKSDVVLGSNERQNTEESVDSTAKVASHGFGNGAVEEWGTNDFDTGKKEAQTKVASKGFESTLHDVWGTGNSDAFGDKSTTATAADGFDAPVTDTFGAFGAAADGFDNPVVVTFSAFGEKATTSVAADGFDAPPVHDAFGSSLGTAADGFDVPVVDTFGAFGAAPDGFGSSVVETFGSFGDKPTSTTISDAFNAPVVDSFGTFGDKSTNTTSVDGFNAPVVDNWNTPESDGFVNEAKKDQHSIVDHDRLKVIASEWDSSAFDDFGKSTVVTVVENDGFAKDGFGVAPIDNWDSKGFDASFSKTAAFSTTDGFASIALNDWVTPETSGTTKEYSSTEDTFGTSGIPEDSKVDKLETVAVVPVIEVVDKPTALDHAIEESEVAPPLTLITNELVTPVSSHPPSAVDNKPSGWFQNLGDLSHFNSHITLHDVLDNTRSKLWSYPLNFGVLCSHHGHDGENSSPYRKTSLSRGNSQNTPVVVNNGDIRARHELKAVLGTRVELYTVIHSNDTAGSNIGLQSTLILPIAAESVIVSPPSKKAAVHEPTELHSKMFLATFSNNCIIAYQIVGDDTMSPSKISSAISMTESPGAMMMHLVKVAEIPMSSTPLVYWQFVSPELIILITNTAGFTWRVAGKVGGPPVGGHSDAMGQVVPSKPEKILERIDLEDGKISWDGRVVVDLSIFKEGWTMLTTCDKPTNTLLPVTASISKWKSAHHMSGANPMRKENSFNKLSPTPASARSKLLATVKDETVVRENVIVTGSHSGDTHLDSYRVTIHLSKLMMGLSFRAVAGCFRNGQVVLLWIVRQDRDTSSGTAPSSFDQVDDLEWRLTIIDKDSIVEYMNSHRTKSHGGLDHPPPWKGTFHLPFLYEDIIHHDVIKVLVQTVVSKVFIPRHQQSSSRIGTLTHPTLPPASPAVSSPTGFNVLRKTSSNRRSFQSNIDLHYTESTIFLSSLPICLAYVYSIANRIFILTNQGYLFQCNASKDKVCGFERMSLEVATAASSVPPHSKAFEPSKDNASEKRDSLKINTSSTMDEVPGTGATASVISNEYPTGYDFWIHSSCLNLDLPVGPVDNHTPSPHLFVWVSYRRSNSYDNVNEQNESLARNDHQLFKIHLKDFTKLLVERFHENK